MRSKQVGAGQPGSYVAGWSQCRPAVFDGSQARPTRAEVGGRGCDGRVDSRADLRAGQRRTRHHHPGDPGLPRPELLLLRAGRSTWSSTSAGWRSSRPTRCPASPSHCSPLLPGLHDHQCSRGRDGGFVERLVEGTWAGHVVEHVALELAAHRRPRDHPRQDPVHRRGRRLQRHLRLPRRDRRHPGRPARGPAGQPPGARTTTSPTTISTSTTEHDDFLRTCQRVAFGPSTQAILDEAIARDIPWQRLNSGSLVQLGHGVNQQRIRATMTSLTSSLAVDIASDKELTNRLLAAAGLPVPTSEVVRRADDAVRMARRIGYPGRAQAAGRQPRPRRRDQPEHRGGGAGRVRGGVRPVPARLRAGRVVHHRQGLPGAGDRRAHGRDRRAGAGARHRRRGRSRSPNWSS